MMALMNEELEEVVVAQIPWGRSQMPVIREDEFEDSEEEQQPWWEEEVKRPARSRAQVGQFID